MNKKERKGLAEDLEADLKHDIEKETRIYPHILEEGKEYFQCVCCAGEVGLDWVIKHPHPNIDKSLCSEHLLDLLVDLLQNSKIVKKSLLEMIARFRGGEYEKEMNSKLDFHIAWRTHEKKN